MKSFAVLVVAVIAFVYVQSNVDSATVPAVAMDPFITLIKEIEAADFFPTLDADDRLLTFEMLTAAETRNLEQLLDRLGYDTLFEYLDVLPKSYQHRFISYSVEHLKADLKTSS